ncbi:MAG TPA: hypothetical protein VND80_11460 [Steroidobacteraceae bacterium]|nr:hypothetical protein [Steroidobacteraceae bacterium]
MSGTPRSVGWRNLRILGLSLILLFVALKTWEEHYQATRWISPLVVAIYPIAGDASPVTARYMGALDAARFAPIDRFFARQAAHYHLEERVPVQTRLRPALAERPPHRPAGAGMLATIAWSLRLRFWAWRIGERDRAPADIQMFVLYRDPAWTPTVPHSLGLEKGLIGVVYAFADPRMNGANDVIIAHELLHTLGATDEYDPANDEPLYPQGYGDPDQVPLFPQKAAELMAGRRMVAPDRWVEPRSLEEVVIGPATARQIRWIR